MDVRIIELLDADIHALLEKQRLIINAADNVYCFTWSFTPENKARIQNLVNKVCMIAEEIVPDRINEIRKEAEGLWC